MYPGAGKGGLELMNYIRHLNAFFSYVKSDTRLTSSHVSLYMALFQNWNVNRFKNPFPITREDVMSLSALGSKNTYHKCLKDLHHFGYIFYRASINKFHKSTVHMVKLSNGDDSGAQQQLDLFSPKIGPQNVVQKLNASIPNPVQVKNVGAVNFDTGAVSNLTFASPKFDTLPVPYLGLLIKHKQINGKQERRKNSLSQKILSKNEKLNQEINKLALVSNSVHDSQLACPAKCEAINEVSKQQPPLTRPVICSSLPSLLQVQEFFTQNNYPSTEASKFYNHYQSNGWLVGGKTPMKDWQSSAHKWMINYQNFQPVKKSVTGPIQKQPNRDVRTDKDYSEPL